MPRNIFRTSSNKKADDIKDDLHPTTQQSPSSPKPQSLSQRAISLTLTNTANLANLLPTGTLLAFELLTPTFTGNGHCDRVTRPLTFVLLGLLSLSCFLASFSDSFKAEDGHVYYGFATWSAMWLIDYPYASRSGLPDLTVYKIRVVDWVHGFLSVLLFGAVALRDNYVLGCFGPKLKNEGQEVMNIVPVGVGLICTLLFTVFPTTRHGLGYPVTFGR